MRKINALPPKPTLNSISPIIYQVLLKHVLVVDNLNTNILRWINIRQKIMKDQRVEIAQLTRKSALFSLG